MAKEGEKMKLSNTDLRKLQLKRNIMREEYDRFTWREKIGYYRINGKLVEEIIIEEIEDFVTTSLKDMEKRLKYLQTSGEG